MHPTVVFDQADAAAEAGALEAFGAAMQLGLALGGTITGEHGIGKLKRQWLEQDRARSAWSSTAASSSSSTAPACSTRQGPPPQRDDSSEVHGPMDSAPG